MLTEFFASSQLASVDIIILLLTAFFGALITAAMGIGGGLLLIAVMANIVPVEAIIPVHGLVQMGSNGTRMYLTRKYVDWQLFRYFAIGAVFAAIAASFILVKLPLTIIQIGVAIFVLLTVWGIKPSRLELSNTGRMLAGAFTTFMSTIIGATGPLVAALFYKPNADQLHLTSTFTSCMFLQHTLKIFVFMGVGFAFLDWLPLVLAMISCGFIGSWVGVHILKRMPAKVFHLGLKVLLTGLSLRLLYQAWN